jgi:DNA-binding NarL/FixJ family response regulator
MKNNTITIAIAEDKQEDIEIIKTALQKLPNYKIVCTAVDGRKLIDEIAKLKTYPDLILMDMQMPLCDGLLATIICKEFFPNTKIVGVSSHTYESVINEFMIEGGNGFLSKHIVQNTGMLSSYYNNPNIFGEVLNKIMVENEIYFDPLCHYKNADFKKLKSTKEIIKKYPELTSINRLFILLNAAGFNREKIAEHLHLTEDAIKKQSLKCRKYFNVESNTDLTNYAIMIGIIKTVRVYQQY